MKKIFKIEIDRYRASCTQIREIMTINKLSGMRIYVRGRYEGHSFDAIDVLKIFEVMRFFAVTGNDCFEVPWYLTLSGKYRCQKLA